MLQVRTELNDVFGNRSIIQLAAWRLLLWRCRRWQVELLRRRWKCSEVSFHYLRDGSGGGRRVEWEVEIYNHL
ncbi:hypothetical protein Mp_7g11640 [Marchantia polymorpha subsp. ruderalis]|uniref:Uncharacterized protein n=2 Tax=Marchantia polymorpha TaxID=3197 RepID=A0AAF6BYH8_MARPO|nr:hypothetical protein MARPO_0003s0176 [Marchantia polymorpha]BBN17062.1 hypothetical protein Mp_7g11640 [Marchantia polymorpha subsp. ruderalis]|eukprot:PTQ49297.1 hypothetical protein MARPO_0003s0176 [Marchantia polymorpha]